MGQFDSKTFNGEVFKKYVDTIPNTKRNELIKSRAIRPRPDLVQNMSDQTGGNYITTPLLGLISGSAPTNYDGNTDIDPKGTETYTHSRVVVGRSNGWTERDFSYDITGGVDFMENVARQVSEYWEEIDQDTLIHILNGLFAMSDAEGRKFVASHTNDVTAKQNSEGVTGNMDGTTLNTTMQRACGDNKSKFSLALMHSVVATNLENLKLLVYLKYNDADGMQRDLAIATLNGRTVLVDDSMPTEDVVLTKGVYTIEITTAATAGDEFTIGSTTLKWVANGATAGANEINLPSTNNAKNEATALYNYLAALTSGELSKYTWANPADGKVSATQKVVGAQEPDFEIDEGATSFAATLTETTASVEGVKYTTYVLGDGAIEYTDCGAKVPYEMDRDPKVHGGEDTLYSRQRKCFAPYGVNFTKASMSSLSPTDAELENGANWELVNNGKSSTARKYISGKAIPIARIISLG